ncbi:5'-methylthioadenosine/S-adenosylhomocysteine nucleosidase [Arthrobacter sp. GMC3]|uniref:5'-methylthioadenosine/S-adenosylhomocysteine nucleosidase n=1 Tax=Arthrobacter sp. GMC3 TaxID=2058894 RepID=UPI000CE3BBF9|nr:5'-methylthioadenosine/S-adenosylhomocysteine nucleosidase [Arthrobacter sp. GMC3]
MSPIDVIVIAAMEEELAPFIERASHVGKPVRVGNATHRTGVINDLSVLLVQGGIGLVNAAGAATSSILMAKSGAERELPPLVISAGTAGGLGAAVKVGDVVIGTNHINIDADARAFGYELGQVPGMPASYPVPSSLVQASHVGAPEHRVGQTVHQGLIVSSYAFVGKDRAERITEQFAGVLATDMESSAIAQTCYVHNTAFVAVRGISDLCGPASETDFLTHVDDAAERSAEIVTAILEPLLASLRNLDGAS